LGPQIGAGASSNVYYYKYCHPDYVNDAGCKKDVVLKMLHRNPDCATALEQQDAIQPEISLTIHSGRHPNIIKFLSAFYVEDDAAATASASSKSYELLSKNSSNGLLPPLGFGERVFAWGRCL